MDLDMPSIDGIMETAQQCCTGKIQNLSLIHICRKQLTQL